MDRIFKKIICGVCVAIFAICGFFSLWPLFSGALTNDSFVGKYPLKNELYYVYGITNRALEKVFMYDQETSIYKLKNGYLARAYDDEDISSKAKKVTNFSNYLREKGIAYSYIMTAEAGDERLGQLPNYAKNEIGILTQKWKDVLDENDVDYLSTFDYLFDTDDYYHYFYKSDHHWNDYAGLYLAEVVTKYLNEEYGFGLDESKFDIEDYNIKRYENLFLGSLGKKVTLGYVNAEDFDLLIPKFETSYDVTISNKEFSGNYFDAIIDKTKLNENADYYKQNCYACYLHGDKTIVNVHNKLCNNGKRILVLKDSKANVVNAHLASSVEYLDVIDLRYFKDGLKEYINSTNPDVVLSIYSPASARAFYEFD